MVSTLAVALVALAAVTPAVSAHSQMTLPNPKFSDVSKANSPLGTVDGPTVLPPPSGQSYAMGTDTNIKAYVQAFKAQTKYTSLKQLIMDNYVEAGTIPDRACGLTDKTYAQPLPAEVEWQAGQHPGPCEVWCDDTLAFHDDDCATNYPGIKLPYDRSKCVGKKVLWSMFLAMHVPQWQVYMGCTAIEGSGSSSTSAGSSSSTPAPKATTKAPTAASTPAPKTTTKAPTTTSTTTPAAASGSEYDDEYASSSPASTPVPTSISTPAPAATKKKCTAKTRRLRK